MIESTQEEVNFAMKKIQVDLGSVVQNTVNILVAAAVGLFGTLLRFIYEWQYCQYFGVPTELITFSSWQTTSWALLCILGVGFYLWVMFHAVLQVPNMPLE